MTYFMIRHKPTGEFMPELREGRGYSHWNPSKAGTTTYLRTKTLGVPRLFPDSRKAKLAIIRWIELPNAHHRKYQSANGDWVESVQTTNDGREIEDLEVVEVNIEIVNGNPT